MIALLVTSLSFCLFALGTAFLAYTRAFLKTSGWW